MSLESRKAPREIASGISFRPGDLAGARSSCELVKVCDFYETKASGGYTDSALCGRYLHAMAREIRVLASALRETEKKRLIKMKRLETVCSEWDEHFAEKGQGELEIVPTTPAAVAAQNRWLRERVKALEAERGSLLGLVEEEKARARRELEEYQTASRENVERLRRRALEDATNASIERDRQLAERSALSAKTDFEERAKMRAEGEARDRRRKADYNALVQQDAAHRNEIVRLKLALADSTDRLDRTEAKLEDATGEVSNSWELRQQAVEEALVAERTVRNALKVSVSTQCPSEDTDSVKFGWSPRLRKPGGRRVLATGAHPTLSSQTLVDTIFSRLGIVILSVSPPRTTTTTTAETPDPHGRSRTVHFELLAATQEDAVRLVEAGSLPDDTAKVIAPTVVREPRVY